MVYFDRKKTEIIIFDLEFYVPLEDRNKKGASLLANPCKKNHFLLGGVFAKYKPLKKENVHYTHFWIWEDGDEKTVLKRIFKYIRSSWAKLKDKDPRQADLIFCGIGISRFDVPILYIRSQYHQIAPQHEIFECYFKAKQLDISNIVIPFFNRDKVMYPKSTNAILSRFGIQKKKESGISVWDMYDQERYHDIEKRTQKEVNDCLKLYKLLSNKIYSNRR